jgi:hypothetical protein
MVPASVAPTMFSAIPTPILYGGAALLVLGLGYWFIKK